MAPSDRTLKTMNAVHSALLKLSGGRFGWKVSGMPVLVLTTTGRNSGQPHTMKLTSPVQEDGTLVVVASRGGGVHHPHWFLNLREDPDVEVSFKGGPALKMRARVADAEERARLWPQVVEVYGGYAKYQSKTEREIPVVLLEPV